MSFDLWRKLPENFLRMKYPRFCKLNEDVKKLIVELAETQKFKCAICKNTARNLVVDHDHNPDEGPGDQFTIFNIRGLVCQGCNWDLGFFEKEERGEAFGWEGVECKLWSGDYEAYKYEYECRVSALREALLKKRIPNYWHRKLVLDRFDAWYHEGGRPPRWYQEYKEQQFWKIETPDDFFRVLVALLKYYSEQFEKNPSYEPPEEFWQMMERIQPLMAQVEVAVGAINPSVETQAKSTD